MPHLRLEYSSNLPSDVAGCELLAQFHAILAENGVSIGNCKSRVEQRPVYMIGDGRKEEAFVHLDVSMLERPQRTKRSIGSALLEVLIAAYEGSSPAPQITVEMRDIKRGDYFKHPAGTI